MGRTGTGRAPAAAPLLGHGVATWATSPRVSPGGSLAAPETVPGTISGWRLRAEFWRAARSARRLNIAPPAGQRTPTEAAGDYAEPRARMVRDQIAARGVREPRVLDAMRRVPRHLFVPEALRAAAYEDYPLPIGHEQTISQPFIVAWMTEALQVTPRSRVLEIGTGSGYQAAVLAQIVAEVYTIEIVAPLAESADAPSRRSATRTCTRSRVTDTSAGPSTRPSTPSSSRRRPSRSRSRSSISCASAAASSCRSAARRSADDVITKGPDGVTREERMPVRFVPLVRP